MQSLYQIQQEYLDVIRRIENGEEGEEIDNALEIAQSQLAQKSVAYVHIMNVLENQKEMAKAEIQRIKKFIEDKDKIIERLEKALLQAVLLFGDQKKPDSPKYIEAGTIRLSTRRNPKVIITEEGDIPDVLKNFYISVTCTYDKFLQVASSLNNLGVQYRATSEPSKTRIKEAIEEHNQIVPGAYYEKDNYSLTIK